MMNGLVRFVVIFPNLTTFNFCWVISCYLLASHLAFGKYLHTYLSNGELSWLAFDALDPLNSWFAELQRSPVLFAMMLNCTTIWTVGITYAFGALFHSKAGWSCFDLLQGGMGHIILELVAWICAAQSLWLPWVTIDEHNRLHLLFSIDSERYDSQQLNHMGLCIISALFTLTSLTFMFFSLFTFEKKGKSKEQLEFLFNRHISNRETKASLKKLKTSESEPDGPQSTPVSTFLFIQEVCDEIDKQELHYEKILGSEVRLYWGLFICLQIITMLYVSLIVAVIDLNILQNRFIQLILSIGFTVFMTLTVALTNSVGGKWLHGSLYKLVMPVNGGTPFMVLQCCAWTFFSLALLITICKLFSIVFLDMEYFQTGYMWFAGLCGLTAEVFLVISLVSFRGSVEPPLEQVEGKLHEESEGESETEVYDDWEECEDEHGNIFYFNVVTNETKLELPGDRPKAY